MCLTLSTKLMLYINSSDKLMTFWSYCIFTEPFQVVFPRVSQRRFLPLISSMSQGQFKGPCLYLGGRDSKWKLTGQLWSISKKRDPGCLVDSSSVTCRWLRNAGSEFPGMEPGNPHFNMFVQPVIIVYLPSTCLACQLLGTYTNGQTDRTLPQGKDTKTMQWQPEGGMERPAKGPAIATGRWRLRQKW